MYCKRLNCQLAVSSIKFTSNISMLYFPQMPRKVNYIFKQAPFLRLLIPLIAGMVGQWYSDTPIIIAWVIVGFSIAAVWLVGYMPLHQKWKWQQMLGLCVHLALIAVGAVVTSYNNKNSGLLHPPSNATWLATLQETPVEKTNVYKVSASIEQLIGVDTLVRHNGYIVMYFQKDSTIANAPAGTEILFTASLQPIKNTSNPGAFNYAHYAAFQHIYYQVFLKKDKYVLLPYCNTHRYFDFIDRTRKWVLQLLSIYIPNKKEAGLAKALLIGYKNDLDNELVQSYINTGVVHIIAISGLHVGLIYWLLHLACKPLQNNKRWRWLRLILIMLGLWLFAVLAGASPSVLRSAVMFSLVAIGESLAKKASIYNTLAASAFVLLCYNPYWLWDVGFQLSYAAVLSIVIFMRPIYQWFYFGNKWIDFLWKLTATTLAAQILTLPICLYQFHQFPNYFLVSNVVAVPLSTFIIVVEILLCLFSFSSSIASNIGLWLQWLIMQMNNFISFSEQLPFALTKEIYNSEVKAMLLYTLIAAMGCWWLQKNKLAFVVGLACLLALMVNQAYNSRQIQQQQYVIVYNIPHRRAIEFIAGNKYFFVGDSSLLVEEKLYNAYLKPTHTLYQVQPAKTLPQLFIHKAGSLFDQKNILMIDNTWEHFLLPDSSKFNIIILSNNPSVYLKDLLRRINCQQVVIDASNPSYKARQWINECEALGLPCHWVVSRGPFVMPI
jgi:competence protein ComEC